MHSSWWALCDTTYTSTGRHTAHASWTGSRNGSVHGRVLEQIPPPLRLHISSILLGVCMSPYLWLVFTSQAAEPTCTGKMARIEGDSRCCRMTSRSTSAVHCSGAGPVCRRAYSSTQSFDTCYAGLGPFPSSVHHRLHHQALCDLPVHDGTTCHPMCIDGQPGTISGKRAVCHKPHRCRR